MLVTSSMLSRKQPIHASRPNGVMPSSGPTVAERAGKVGAEIPMTSFEESRADCLNEGRWSDA